jgi:16S rRNA (cytidine1402-2'-O)-methyltransferase
MKSKKRQELPNQDLDSNHVWQSVGGPGALTRLWVVGTPLGNLGDLSARATQILGQVDGVLCEDTRRTSHLMSHLGLTKSLYRLDQHSHPSDISRFIREMENGKTFAYVSDAGTPAISDPGSDLVQACFEAGIPVSPVPGPSAVTALLSVGGFNETAFSFRGFFPRKEAHRKSEIQTAQKQGGVVVWFESPERIAETLDQFRIENEECWVLVAKELTKTHEKIFKGSVKNIASHIQSELAREGNVGEWVFAVHFPATETSLAALEQSSGEWKKCLEICIKCGVSPSSAAREVSQSFGVSKNSVYDYALELAKNQNLK